MFEEDTKIAVHMSTNTGFLGSQFPLARSTMPVDKKQMHLTAAYEKLALHQCFTINNSRLGYQVTNNVVLC